MISAHTQLVVLLGHPVAHSRSPAMLNAAFLHRRVDAVYLAWDIEPGALSAAVATLAATRALGANLTVPHKEAVLRFAPVHAAEVQLLGAANCLTFGAEVAAHNTDATGLARSWKESFKRLRGPALVLGAGGAARAALWALAEHGVREVQLVNRDGKRRAGVLALAKKLGLHAHAHAWSALPSLFPDTSLLINATSAQVKHEPLRLPLALLPKSAIVSDLSYGDTALCRAATTLALRNIEGSGMLLHQAAAAFELWTHKKAPLSQLRAALWDAVRGRDTSKR